jgi:hypothetical protein
MNRSGVLKQLFSCYPNTMIQPETVAMYDRLLADIPDEVLQTVVDHAIAASKFLPSIAEIRTAAYDATHTDRLTSIEAWESVKAQMRKVGWVGTPTFTDEITAQVVKAMGWRYLCGSENEMADRSHFCKAYDAITNRQETDAKLLPEVRELRRLLANNNGWHPLGITDGGL